MVIHNFHGVLLVVLSCFTTVCSAHNEDLDSTVRKAIGRLLARHESFPANSTEQSLVLGVSDGFPDPNTFVLPNAILWEPHVQLPLYLPSDILCPICNEDGITNHLRPSGWKDGRASRHMPRRIYGLSGMVLLISRVYSCRAGHEVNGHDPALLIMIQSSGRIPFLLSHRAGVTKELLEMIVSMVRNKLSFTQIHDILVERIRMRHLHRERRFLEDVNSYSARHPIVYETFFPAFIQPRECPSRDIISNFFLHYFDLNEHLFITRMSSTTTDEGWLSCDHTFNVTGSIGYERKEDGKWIRQYESMFCILNEKGQVLTWQLTQTQGFDNIQHLLRQLLQRISSQGKTIKEFYVDNCCHWRNKLQATFGSDLAVKLDIFHAFQRISSTISKRHPFYWKCLQDVRLIFRDPADLGVKRTKITPDPETLLQNAETFLKKWQNVACDKGVPVLPEESFDAVQRCTEHMRKGCLSGQYY